MKNKNVLFMTRGAMIAAAYVVLLMVFAPFGFGGVQVRIAEMLTILPFFSFAAVPGVFLGCLIGNILGGCALPDVIFGSLTTLVAAFLTYGIGKMARSLNYGSLPTAESKGPSGNKKMSGTLFWLILASIPPIVLNALVIPFILRYAYGEPLPIPFLMLTVGLGEVISCGVFGVVLGQALKRKNLLMDA